jgi:hypothetical protein
LIFLNNTLTLDIIEIKFDALLFEGFCSLKE